MEFISNTEKETVKFANKIAGNLNGGEIIGLIGDLGAGKTTFTKALAKKLGVKKNVASPTFVLMKVYKVAKRGSVIKNLVHIDAYRLKTTTDLESIGALEYFKRPDTIFVIEWADRVRKILPKKTKYFYFEIREGSRIIKRATS